MILCYLNHKNILFHIFVYFLPQLLLNLKIVDLQGNDISLSKAFIRFLVAIPSILSGLWIIVALIRKDNQCLHDVVSNTQLVLKT